MNRMKRKIRHDEQGAFAIEAVFSMTIFMVAICALLMMSMLMRAQAAMQNALNQTAREISGYFYLLDKFGISSIISNEQSANGKQSLEQMNQSIGHIVEFAGDSKKTVSKYKNAAEQTAAQLRDGKMDQKTLEQFQQIGDDAKALEKEATTVKNDLQKLWKSDNKIDMLKGILEVFGRTMINTAFSKYVAAPVCAAMFPRYLTDGDINQYYENLGIDPDSVTFEGSDLLADGRTIRLVVTYKMDASKLTLGFYKKDLFFRQVAVTAAWINPEGSDRLNTLAQVGQKVNGNGKNTDGEQTDGGGDKKE